MQNTVLVLLAIGGLVFSILSILEKYVKGILSFCEIFGQGCRRTLKFHLFGIPASWYGAAYYIVLIFLIFLMKPWVYWFVMVGFGIELTFIWIMVYNIRAFCLFCTLNAVMMGGLFLYVFDISRVWESLSIILICFITSLFFFQRENISEFSDSAEAGAEEDGNIADVKDDPTLGSPDASVAVVEFSDYLCPGCRKAHDISKTIKEKYGDHICWVFKDFPLKQHKGSDKMAEAAHCADDQGKFWQYQDLMFSSEGPVDLQQLEKYAEDLDLDTDKFRHCMETQKHRRKVEKNRKNGKEAGVSVTPTFIINGQKISGTLTVERFEKRIEDALRNVQSIKTEDGKPPQNSQDQCSQSGGCPSS